jgi:glycosyltransferase involved in cell wall biosynthesis
MTSAPRLIILADSQKYSEIFLNRDIAAMSADANIEVVYIREVRIRIGLWRHLPIRVVRNRIAKQIIADKNIRREDTVLAYWSNYILDLAAIISRETGCKLQAFCHANDLFRRTYLGRIPPAEIDQYFFCCRKNIEWAQKAFSIPTEKISYRPHPLPNLPQWKPPAASEFAICNIARDVPKKNLDAVFNIIDDLADSIPHIQFIQAGIHSRHTYRISRSNIEVKLPGPIPFSRVLEIMLQSHLFMYGSRIDKTGDRDGVPNVLREAGEMGMPVVAEKGWANDEVVFKGPALLVGSLKDEKERIKQWVRALYPAFFVGK